MNPEQKRALILDVVILLPADVRQRAIECSSALATLMDDDGARACFRLGAGFPGETEGSCEPHVSLFMLTVDEDEIDQVRTALDDVVPALAAFAAEATEYRFNREGAPELFYRRSDPWRRTQAAVIGAVEPLRRGRLRDHGPGGEVLADVVADGRPDDPALVRQLLRYGYDAVSDDHDDRFDPHVTLTWPRDEAFRVDLSALPRPSAFDGTVGEIGLYEMSPNGTCTRCRGTWALGAHAAAT